MCVCKGRWLWCTYFIVLWWCFAFSLCFVRTHFRFFLLLPLFLFTFYLFFLFGLRSLLLSLSLSGCRNICSENSHRSFFPVDLSAKEGHVQHTARCLLCCFLPGSERKGEHSFACSFLALFFLFVCQCCLHIRSPSL